jgi:SAM-dependent methyltransferase
MSNHDLDQVFAGSIPAIYETYLVPMIFAPYAADLASRVAQRSPTRVLEIAAGTGVVTRALASILPQSAAIVATDLNRGMLDQAAMIGAARPIEWRQANAQRLPFADATFDAVVCQFGAMFFPDKAQAFAEARRVLRPGGVYLFSVWDRIEECEFEDTVTAALASVFPDDPPSFLARTPHGYHDKEAVARDLASGGFDAPPEIVTLAERSRADSPRIPAVAYCHGTILHNEIEARDPARLGEATDAVERAMAQRFGSGPIDGKMQAHIITVERRYAML